MKKLLMLIPLVAVTMSYSSGATADHGYYEHRGHGHHGGYPQHRPHHYREEVIYYQAPPVQYYAPPPVQYYAPAPPVQYYPAPPVVNRYPAQRQSNYSDQRSPQGLMGGVVGSALGYEMGRGDPVATGLGAAAGAFVGNNGSRW